MYRYLLQTILKDLKKLPSHTTYTDAHASVFFLPIGIKTIYQPFQSDYMLNHEK